MKKTFLLLALSLVLTGCGRLPGELNTTEPGATMEPMSAEPTAPTVPIAVPTESTPATQPDDPIETLLSSMTLEQRVGQILLARCNADTAISDIENYHLGGFVLFGADFEDQTIDSFRNKADGYQAAADIPLLLTVDEEGGDVTRISRYAAFRSSKFPSLRTSWEKGGLGEILTIEGEKCDLLAKLGINVNLGPVCDISREAGAFMYSRSLGQDATTTAEVVSEILALYQSKSMGTVLKHFPGYGNNADTHVGLAVDSRNLDQLETRDLVPFAAGIEAGAGAILVSHNIVEALDASAPASLSAAVHEYLRETMGFDGVILTDDLYMQAITDQYGVGEAAVLAVLAGNDMLCVTEYQTQYRAILEAVDSGRIPEETLNAAVRHVLRWKEELGLI